MAVQLSSPLFCQDSDPHVRLTAPLQSLPEMCEPLGDPALPRRVGSKVIQRRERSENREAVSCAAERDRVRIALLELIVIQIACCLPTASPSRLPGSLLGRAVDRSV